MAVYATAYYAGLRRKELNKLKLGDFRLDCPRPFVRVPGIAAKNGETQDVPLHMALVAILQSHWPEGIAPFAWAFYGHVPNMETWRRDLERAGIPYKDAEGRRFDFHALRMTLNTHLREVRVGLEDRMAILRWSDPRLAGETYMDERQINVAAEIAKLPAVQAAQAPLTAKLAVSDAS
jgi:integrase